jgi:hypothetical protein
VKIADLVLLVFLMSSLPLVSLDYFQHILGSDTLVKLEPLVNTGLVIAMGLGILGSFVDILKHCARSTQSHPSNVVMDQCG